MSEGPSILFRFRSFFFVMTGGCFFVRTQSDGFFRSQRWWGMDWLALASSAGHQKKRERERTRSLDAEATDRRFEWS